MTPQVSRLAFFNVWFKNVKESRADSLLKFIQKELSNVSFSDESLKKLKMQIRSHSYRMKEKWAKSGRNRQRFLNKNSLWLQGQFSFPNLGNDCGVKVQLPGDLSQGDRPQKDFQTSSILTRRRGVQHLSETTTDVHLGNDGKRDSAATGKELRVSSPDRGTAIKKARTCSDSKNQERLSADNAVALMVDASLSTHQYNTIRQQVNQTYSNMYPPYYKVKAARQLCYPADIIVTETGAEVKLQALMDHTITRICKAQEEVLNNLSDLKCMEIIVKWGCDGEDQTKNQQQFSEEKCSDESLFSISMVPIQLRVECHNIRRVVWQNPSPASKRYCRPIKFVFAKKTANLINTEVEKIQQEINSLLPTKIFVHNIEVSIKPTLIFCMIDGQICNASASCDSTQACFLCGAKPKDMNNRNVIISKTVSGVFLSLGLSPLHLWIRFFECILHISYRLDIKSWQIRGDENNKVAAEKKEIIQHKFRQELGLLIDMPNKQTGNTNDGNTARTFFRNAEKSAEITGVNVDLIKRFHIILECINSGFPINIHKFDAYVTSARDLYIAEYFWYPMPVSVHKILFHGKDIISSCILPIGQLSEMAQKARNKDNMTFRELFTMKTSKVDTNRDLFNRLLISSDPFIANLRSPPKAKRGQITPEVYELLALPAPKDRG